jgi:bacterioferritin-associated ferredoxin
MILIILMKSQGIEPMIVCVCNNISDREIRQAVELGISSMSDLYKELGVGTCCGKCVSYAREVLHEQLETRATTVTELRRTPMQAA